MDRENLEKIKRLRHELHAHPELSQPFRASEDFGYYLKQCPGAIFYIGNGEDHPQLHTAEYDFNDGILERATDLFFALLRV